MGYLALPRASLACYRASAGRGIGHLQPLSASRVLTFIPQGKVYEYRLLPSFRQKWPPGEQLRLPSYLGTYMSSFILVLKNMHVLLLDSRTVRNGPGDSSSLWRYKSIFSPHQPLHPPCRWLYLSASRISKPILAGAVADASCTLVVGTYYWRSRPSTGTATWSAT